MVHQRGRLEPRDLLHDSVRCRDSSLSKKESYREIGGAEADPPQFSSVASIRFATLTKVCNVSWNGNRPNWSGSFPWPRAHLIGYPTIFFKIRH